MISLQIPQIPVSILSSPPPTPPLLLPMTYQAIKSTGQSPAKRPKLSLQISPSEAPRTFGKSTTGLKSDVAVNSPTARNTYSNAYQTTVPAYPSPKSSVSSAQSPVLPRTEMSSPAGESTPSFDDTTSPSSTSQGSPYKIPLGVQPILRNSLRPSAPHKYVCNPRLLSPPPRKCVSFSSNLSRDIKTTQYIKTHYELLQEEETFHPLEGDLDTTELKRKRNAGISPGPMEDLRQSIGELNGEERDTPMPRKRKEREWTWTLGTREVELDETAPASASSRKSSDVSAASMDAFE
ncbi:MAG: hypothetical protein M1824_001439 [Vezdaea acicularis]|nr:MAG: hypothetical protein M1824_001439 [Vezdaea acicularis]